MSWLAGTMPPGVDGGDGRAAHTSRFADAAAAVTAPLDTAIRCVAGLGWDEHQAWSGHHLHRPAHRPPQRVSSLRSPRAE